MTPEERNAVTPVPEAADTVVAGEGLSVQPATVDLRRCENCAHWSTGRLGLQGYGSCAAAEQFGSPMIVSQESAGDRPAWLETREVFSCALWSPREEPKEGG